MKPKTHLPFLPILWLTLSNTASAHGPYVEQWKTNTALGIAIFLGLLIGYLVREKIGIIGAIIVAIIVSALSWFLGSVYVLYSSM